jgi:hypothetical protein
VLLVSLAGACRREPAPPIEERAAPSSKPLDRLAPGELAAGTDRAFSLTLPEKLKVVRRVGTTVYARGTAKPADVATFVRERVVASHVELEKNRTVFPNVTVRGADPARRYRIEVLADGAQTELIVRDVTPVPMPPGLSEEERWKRAGLAPNGRVLNVEKLD